ncbi:diguanylate cyclase [Acerihabitans sp. KWT182]|uniref:Diguanylate cyclase n=1 Tax=Acerihabitans sp. KWT182 TaxID=3157919 RepID=A0AAU7Q5U0_9GAMM
MCKKSLFCSDILLPALEQATDAVIIIDDKNNVLFFNNRAENLWGYSRHEVLGHRLPLPGIRIADQGDALYAPQTDRRRDVQIKHKDGQKISVSLALSKIVTSDKNYYMGVLHPTENIIPGAENPLLQQTHFDALTALPNRQHQYQHIDELLKSGQQKQFAIFFVDLVHFKEVNTTLGYAAGDTVLVKIARRFEEHLNKIAFISRSHSDSFVLIAAGCDAPRARLLAEKILSLFHLPFDVSGFALDISASIGVSLYPDNGADRDTLLRHANIATHSSRMPASGGYLFSARIWTRWIRSGLLWRRR